MRRVQLLAQTQTYCHRTLKFYQAWVSCDSNCWTHILQLKLGLMKDSAISNLWEARRKQIALQWQYRKIHLMKSPPILISLCDWRDSKVAKPSIHNSAYGVAPPVDIEASIEYWWLNWEFQFIIPLSQKKIIWCTIYLWMCMHVCMCIYLCVCVRVYIYIYI